MSASLWTVPFKWKGNEMWSFHGPFLDGSEVFSENDNHFPPTS